MVTLHPSPSMGGLSRIAQLSAWLMLLLIAASSTDGDVLSAPFVGLYGGFTAESREHTCFDTVDPTLVRSGGEDYAPRKLRSTKNPQPYSYNSLCRNSVRDSKASQYVGGIKASISWTRTREQAPTTRILASSSYRLRGKSEAHSVARTYTNNHDSTRTLTQTPSRYFRAHIDLHTDAKCSLLGSSNSELTGGGSEAWSAFSTVDTATGRRQLTYYGLMLAGAVARSVSATAVHPLNVIKTVLQMQGGRMPELSWRVLSRGAGAQLAMSVPHGAVNFAITETTKAKLAEVVHNSSLARVLPVHVLNPAMDFLASSVSTFVCSAVSTPQMVIVDRIMAGVYPHFLQAVTNIYAADGVLGFYTGWLPALAQKIPSYALTWTFFQQLKALFLRLAERAGTTLENMLLGSAAAACACCVMIPLDTIKTRIVTQPQPSYPGEPLLYSGMLHCARKILTEEGLGAFYRALPPRLMSVVPMIGIQFGVYELMKRLLLHRPPPKQEKREQLRRLQQMQEQVQAQVQQQLQQAQQAFRKVAPLHPGPKPSTRRGGMQ